MKTNETYDPKYIKGSEIRNHGRAVRPRDAATLIVVRRDGPQPTILMGKRAASHKFMPNKYVFPGGRVDIGDGRIKPPYDLHPAVLERLSQGCSESRARALALAAFRETFEETGLILGEPDTPTLRTRSLHWRQFLQFDVNPRLDALEYIARAITPPYRSRRFDARFFMCEADLIQGDVHDSPEGSGELLGIHWVTLEDAQKLELPNITRMVLGEVEQRLEKPHAPADKGPFVYFRHGKPVVDSI